MRTTSTRAAAEERRRKATRRPGLARARVAGLAAVALGAAGFAAAICAQTKQELAEALRVRVSLSAQQLTPAKLMVEVGRALFRTPTAKPVRFRCGGRGMRPGVSVTLRAADRPVTDLLRGAAALGGCELYIGPTPDDPQHWGVFAINPVDLTLREEELDYAPVLAEPRAKK